MKQGTCVRKAVENLLEGDFEISIFLGGQEIDHGKILTGELELERAYSASGTESSAVLTKWYTSAETPLLCRKAYFISDERGIFEQEPYRCSDGGIYIDLIGGGEEELLDVIYSGIDPGWVLLFYKSVQERCTTTTPDYVAATAFDDGGFILLTRR
jgi:hypothetical protein